MRQTTEMRTKLYRNYYLSSPRGVTGLNFQQQQKERKESTGRVRLPGHQIWDLPQQVLELSALGAADLTSKAVCNAPPN